MEDENRPVGRPYELFGEVKQAGDQQYETADIPDYDFENLSPGQETARQSVPLRRKTDQQRREDQQAIEEDAPGVAEGLNTATQLEWVGRLMADQKTYPPDPDMVWTPEKVLEYGEGLPEEAFPFITEAQSDEEAAYRAEHYRRDMAREEEMAKMGFTGTGLRVGAAFLDPAAWGIGVAASSMFGPAGLVGTAANRLSRATRIVRGGTAAATGNVAVEAAIGANKPIWDEMNLLYAAGIGFGLGGGLSAISRNPSTQAEAGALRNASKGLKAESEAEIKKFYETSSYRPVDAPEASLDDAGAMRVSRYVPLKEGDDPIDNFYENLKADPSVAPRAGQAWARKVGGLKTSSMSMGLTSENPGVRALFKPLAEEGVGYTDRNAPVAISASERQRKRHGQVETEWMRGHSSNVNDWLKDQNPEGTWHPWQKDDMTRVFNEQVTDYVEGVRENVHPAVARQGEVMRKVMDDYRQDANQPMAYRQENGRPLKNFGTLEEDPFYVPHIHDLGKVRSIAEEVGTPNLETLVAESIKRGMKDTITDVQARRYGTNYLKTLRMLHTGMGGDPGRILASGDAEEIKRLIRDNSTSDSISDVEIGDLVDALTFGKKDREGGSSRGRQRTPLDMNTTLTLRKNPEKHPEGGSREVSIRELFNRDAHDLTMRYSRQMSGAIAMGRYKIPGLADGITSRGEWETLMDRVRAIGDHEKVPSERTNRELEEANQMYNAIMGIPNKRDMTPYGQATKYMRDWAFTRYMGQVGFAQLPEAGVATAGVGIKAMMKGMSSYRGLLRSTQDGTIADETIDEMELITGTGSEWLTSGQIQRFNDTTGTADTQLGSSKTRDRVESSIKSVKRGVFAGSGMATVNTVLKRATASGIANKFADAAINGKKPLGRNRLRSIGLTDAQADRILENLRNHADFKDGLTGRKLERLNIHKWDLAAEADFSEASFRYINRLVQENDLGQMRMWMTDPTAKTFLQFRTFIIAAHEKQLLHNLHMRDFQTFTTFAASSLMATLGYSAMTYMRSVGRSDQEEYLQRRMAPKELAKASFERSSWSALIPTAVDSFSPGTFGYSRSSGQDVSLWFGNPTADTIGGAGQALRTLATGQALDSQEDLRSLSTLLPFQNMNGVLQMSNIMIGSSGLPEDAPRDRD